VVTETGNIVMFFNNSSLTTRALVMIHFGITTPRTVSAKWFLIAVNLLPIHSLSFLSEYSSKPPILQTGFDSVNFSCT